MSCPIYRTQPQQIPRTLPNQGRGNQNALGRGGNTGQDGTAGQRGGNGPSIRPPCTGNNGSNGNPGRA